MNWNDKVVVITGSSIGIGRKLAVQLLQKGACVVINARNADRLANTFKALQDEGQGRLLAVAGDVAQPSDCAHLIQQTCETFGRVDALINNAGIAAEGDIGELSPAVFRKVTEVNFLGSIYATQQALPYLRESQGAVLFVSSLAAIRGIPGHAVYSASKMALTAAAEALRLEERVNGVHVALAFVGFTENDPQKAIYDKDGRLVAQPARDFIRQEPATVVAARLIRMIEKRQFKKVFTPIGKLNGWMSRFLPGIVERVLYRAYQKRQS